MLDFQPQGRRPAARLVRLLLLPFSLADLLRLVQPQTGRPVVRGAF